MMYYHVKIICDQYMHSYKKDYIISGKKMSKYHILKQIKLLNPKGSRMMPPHLTWTSCDLDL